MKKASSKNRAEPSAASLRELPEIDFAKFRARRNPYAAVIAAGGGSLVHDGPSASSLAALPELDLSRVTARKSRYAMELKQLETGRGRPKKGQGFGPSPARSVRLPQSVWTALEQAADGANTTVHALLRLAVSKLLEADLAGGGPRRSGLLRPDARRGPRQSQPARRPARPGGSR